MHSWLSPSLSHQALPQTRELAGKRVTVMGLGRFGGGLGVAQWLLQHGARVTITDLEREQRLKASVAALAQHPQFANARLVLGRHDEHDFTSCDLVVANVAVPKPWENAYVLAAQRAGVAITTEIALTIDRLRGHRNVIAITGTVGKSTTTAMVHHALRAVLPASSRVLLGGNIGGSLLAELDAVAQHDWVVLELSSAQLWWINQLLVNDRAWSAAIACLTTFADNHGDWHGDIAHYHASKALLFAHQRAGDYAVFGPGLLAHKHEADATKHNAAMRLSTELAADIAAGLPTSQRFRVQAGVTPCIAHASDFALPLALPGEHNRLNAAIASALLRFALAQAGLPALHAAACEALAQFQGLAHRLQRVGVFGGVTFFNDSKSTTPQATLTALDAVEASLSQTRPRIHLIAGGYDKHSDLSPIARAMPRLAGLYTIGATGPSLHALAASSKAHACGTIAGAMQAISQHATAGDCVLLSPGCASWDQFENYEQRGEAFVSLAKGFHLSHSVHPC